MRCSPLIANKDLKKVPYIHPTTYFIADEKNYTCKSDALVSLKNTKGKEIAKICKRYMKALVMEGTGILKDRGQGRLTVNWAGNNRFRVLNKCIYGEGAGSGKRKDGASNCLLPFHTLAANLGPNGYKVGDVLYIPKADGIVLPNGSVHNGIFEVRDTGGAFRNERKQRVDMFVGLQRDEANVFAQAGFQTSAPWDDYEAFLITGNSKREAQRTLKEKYPNLY